MRRRDFLVALGGMAAWPVVTRAQPSTMPVIGFLNSGARDAFIDRVAGFHRGLNESGFVERQNVTVEYRWAGGQLDRLPALAADLVRRQVSVIAATGNIPSALAAKAATATIPIIFISGPDPVKIGLVASMNQPGGNATGVSSTNNELGAKRLQLLRELVPGATRATMLVNSTNPNAEIEARDLQEIAPKIGLQVLLVRVGAEQGFEAAFTMIIEQRAGALLVPADPFLTSQRNQIIALAARHRIPTIYHDRVFAFSGGLFTYGPSLPEMYRQVGIYTGMILKGAKPNELPVVQPTKFEMIINLKTSKTLGITIPTTLLALADEVIE